MASAVVLALGPSAFAQPAGGSSPAATLKTQATVDTGDDLPDPLGHKRRALKQKALNDVLAGKIKPVKRGASTVAKVGRTASAKSARTGLAAAPAEDQYVELSREKTDKIFVILTEFGDDRHADFPDKDINPAIPGPSTFLGPLRNQIPEPDRKKDNSTVWQADYSHEFFQKLYFGADQESVKTYFEKQSSGRYSVDGTVTDWVKVKYNEARYGRSSDVANTDPKVCAGSVCENTHELIKDAIDTWVANQKAAGRTDAQIKAELASFDVWDRNDYDRDGDFNEPDGYLDHFQIVHSGGDQADGDPSQGEDAIWSHRWYAFGDPQDDIGKRGPSYNLAGGTPVGETGLWIGDYTIQPENGGLSVFVHEYVHDLGEPDYYDTSGGGDNSVEHWSLMAQSRLGAKNDGGIGERPGDLGAREKFNLGWLDYEVVPAAEKRTLDLGPSEYNTDKPQAIIVPLPKKKVVTPIPVPAEGTKAWWSDKGDSLNNSLTRDVTLPAGSAQLTFKANYDIEDCDTDACDYAYVEVDDGTGGGFKAIHGSITNADEGDGIDGSTNAAWVPATFDLSVYAGKTIKLRMRYNTDGGLAKLGFFFDDLKITAGDTTVFADGGETGDNGWTVAGFKHVSGPVTVEYDHRYIATNRTYVSWDQYLQYGPYNFGWLNPAAPQKPRPDWVEHYPYQQGLLIWYIDESVPDNNVNVHPGSGMALVVDSRPQTMYRLDGVPWRSRIQMYDAPFGFRKAPTFDLHFNGIATKLRGQTPNNVFIDTDEYYDENQPNHGIKLPGVGVKIQVLKENGTTVRVKVAPAPPKK